MSDKPIALENRPAYVEVLDVLLTYHRSKQKSEEEIRIIFVFHNPAQEQFTFRSVSGSGCFGSDRGINSHSGLPSASSKFS